MENSEKIIARQLLSIGAVFLRPGEPFTWASGIKSPIYCDNRLILSAPESRNIVEQAIADKVRELYPEAEALMGTSTAGIAHAAIAASILGLPMGYVRSSAKDHGRTNKIEGKLNPGEKVVVIEDLISTAGSCIDVVDALREAGAEVLGVISIGRWPASKMKCPYSHTGWQRDSQGWPMRRWRIIVFLTSTRSWKSLPKRGISRRRI